MAHRYFTEDIAGGTARITGPDAAHLARVLRAKPGDVLTLADGKGTDYEAEITAAAPEEIVLRVLAGGPSSAEPSLHAEMFIGYARGERLEWAIQKCVELGAAVITPFFSASSVVKPKKEEEKNARYNRIALEAAKQSGRGLVPRVELPLAFPAVLEKAAACGLALFLYEGGGKPLRGLVTPGLARVAVITGPEGGFTPAEAAAAQQAGCVPVGLGPRILRCETAPAAALAAIMAISGNME